MLNGYLIGGLIELGCIVVLLSETVFPILDLQEHIHWSAGSGWLEVQYYWFGEAQYDSIRLLNDFNKYNHLHWMCCYYCCCYWICICSLLLVFNSITLCMLHLSFFEIPLSEGCYGFKSLFLIYISSPLSISAGRFKRDNLYFAKCQFHKIWTCETSTF